MNGSPDLDTFFEEFEEDFAAPNAKYQIVAHALSADGDEIGCAVITEHFDPQSAIDEAKWLLANVSKGIVSGGSEGASTIRICVETVVDQDGEGDADCGTLFDETAAIV